VSLLLRFASSSYPETFLLLPGSDSCVQAFACLVILVYFAYSGLFFFLPLQCLVVKPDLVKDLFLSAKNRYPEKSREAESCFLSLIFLQSFVRLLLLLVFLFRFENHLVALLQSEASSSGISKDRS
jgi:hypothetical protein